MIIGQIIDYVTLTPSAGIKILGVNFKPFGFYNLFSLSPLPLQNTLIHAKNLFGIDNTGLTLSQMKSAQADTELILLASNLLKNHAKKFKQTENQLFDKIVRTIINKNGPVKINDIVQGNSNIRALQRHFRQHIGIQNYLPKFRDTVSSSTNGRPSRNSTGNTRIWMRISFSIAL